MSQIILEQLHVKYFIELTSTISHRSVEQTVSDSSKEDSDDSEGDIEDGGRSQEGVPEPEDKVHLLFQIINGILI